MPKFGKYTQNNAITLACKQHPPHARREPCQLYTSEHKVHYTWELAGAAAAMATSPASTSDGSCRNPRT
jgi:hypothetical protein|uniref:Uncharacterized protein n=2 Tax=Oryza TaxID=4527 RepID=A0A0E0QQV9_ORYRU